jgi:hypothetical protein
MRIAILGGGVAGVVLARELASSSAFSITLYERNRSLGGLHRSVEFGGAEYDIGAFVFDYEHALLKTFPFLYDHFVPIDYRSIVVTQQHTLDRYPMSMRGYLRDHGALSLIADAASLVAAKVHDRRRDSLPAFVHYYLGRRIYRRSGLKAYIERFYAVPDNEVDLEFAYQRLYALPAECGLRRNFARIVRESFDTTIAEQTWPCYVRPKEGFPYAYALIESALREDGVAVQLNAEIGRVERVGDTFALHMQDGTLERFDLVISTIPLGVMMRLIGKGGGRPPETTRLISLCYRFRGDLGFERACMLYNFTYEGDWKRLTLYSAQYGLLDGEHYFVVECTQRPDDPRTPDYHRQSFERHIARLPVLNGELKFQGSLVTDDAYPFFRRDDLARAEEARQVVTDYGIAIAGRQGSFNYMTAHATAVAAKELAQRIHHAREESLA